MEIGMQSDVCGREIIEGKWGIYCVVKLGLGPYRGQMITYSFLREEITYLNCL